MATSLLVINEVQLDLDLLDADVLETYDSLMKDIKKKIDDPKFYDDCETEPAKMRKQCRLLDGFFNGLFGEGTADACFGKNNNLGKRLDGFGAVVEYASQQQGRITDITEKYSSNRIMNREQRRAAQFGGANRIRSHQG